MKSIRISKKALTLLLVVVMVFSLSMAIPQTTQTVVYAAQVTSPLDFRGPTLPTPKPGDGWTWNNTTKTLTLNGFIYNGGSSGEWAIQLPDKATVIINGTNRIINNGDVTRPGVAIVSYGDLTVKGTGELRMVTFEKALCADGVLKIESGTIDVISNESGFDTSGDIAINGGNINIDSGEFGMFALNSITINGGTIAITSKNNGLNAYHVAINGGNVTIKSDYEALCGNSSITINGGVLDATSRLFCGIYTEQDIFFNGGAGTIKSLSGDPAIGSMTKKHSLKSGMVVLGWDGKAHTKNSITGTSPVSWDSNPRHTFLDAVTKKAHTNLRYGQDITKVKTTIADMVWTGNQLKPTAFIVDGKSYPISNNATNIKYGANKKIGKGTVTLTGNSIFLGTKTISFNIVPKKNKVSGITTGNKKMTVAWSKVSKSQGVKKYQIKYRENSNAKWKIKTVSASKSKLVIKKLKSGQKYQVQVRSGKKVSGIWYYSSWSKTKTSGKIK